MPTEGSTDTCIHIHVTYMWKICPQGSRQADFIFSQQMAQVSSLIISSWLETRTNRFSMVSLTRMKLW